jgi:hypothetical protein
VKKIVVNEKCIQKNYSVEESEVEVLNYVVLEFEIQKIKIEDKKVIILNKVVR